MKIVREKIIIQPSFLNENMQQAKAIIRKLNIPESDERFQKLKRLLVNDNRIGYMGKFAKWLFEDNEPWDSILEIYKMAKSFKGKMKSIDQFKTLEDFYDYIQATDISSKTDKAIKALNKRLIYFKLNPKDEEKLRKLLELNIEHIKSIEDFYNKKGRKFKSFNELFKSTSEFLKNLSGDFNLASILKKLEDKNANVDIILSSPELLVVKVKDYETSCSIGSQSWCITTSRNQWDSYADEFANQYFVYDFTKDISDKRSMVGITMNYNNSMKAAHFKDDSAANSEYVNELFAK